MDLEDRRVCVMLFEIRTIEHVKRSRARKTYESQSGKPITKLTCSLVTYSLLCGVLSFIVINTYSLLHEVFSFIVINTYSLLHGVLSFIVINTYSLLHRVGLVLFIVITWARDLSFLLETYASEIIQIKQLKLVRKN